MQIINGVFKFTNLGREKITKTVRVKSEKSFIRAIKPPIWNSDISWKYCPVKNEGKIFVGLTREVGQFTRVGE